MCIGGVWWGCGVYGVVCDGFAVVSLCEVYVAEVVVYLYA